MTAGASQQQFFVPLPTGVSDRATQLWGQQLVTELRKNLVMLKDSISTSAETDQATLDRIASLETVVAGLGDVLAGYDTLTAQQAYVLSLVTAVNEIDGAASKRAKESFEWAQKAAMNDGLNMVRSYVDTGKNRTAIINEQTVRITDDAAIALTVEAVNASFGLSQSNVTAIKEAYASGDVAVAVSLNSTSTQVAGNTAGITELQTSFDGISAKWSVQVNAQNQAIGLVSLDGSGNTSTFAVMATTFYVAQPSTTGGDPIQVFTIGSRAGVPALGVRGDLYLDGSILARHLSVSTLTAISADFGTATVSGAITSTNGKVELNFNTGRFRWIA